MKKLDVDFYLERQLSSSSYYSKKGKGKGGKKGSSKGKGKSGKKGSSSSSSSSKKGKGKGGSKSSGSKGTNNIFVHYG